MKVMVVSILLATITFSCKNDIEKVRGLTEAQSIPSLRILNLDGRLTDSGIITTTYKTPTLNQYNFATEKYTDFPDGVEVFRYTDSATLDASLRADKAIFFEEKSLWEATGDVKVKNSKGELLETEKLYWDQKEGKIHTDAWVKITNEDMVINGEGLISDESFSEYEILRVSNSVVYLKDKGNMNGKKKTQN
jgi:LPS export ABC transporter protein LptC